MGRTQKAEQERLERLARRAARKSRKSAAPVIMTARDKEVLGEIAKGLTYHEIGVALGISHQRVAQVAKKHGIARGRGTHMKHKEPVKHACAQCGELTVNRRFCNSRCYGAANKGNTFGAKVTPEQVVEIRKMIAQGMSLAQVAALFPINVSGISHINTRRTWSQV